MKTQSSRHSDRFTARFQLVKKHNDQNNPDLPFRYLASDGFWHVSKILDPRRSNGEKELIALSGQSLLLPQDQAFHPDAEGLRWRSERLTA